MTKKMQPESDRYPLTPEQARDLTTALIFNNHAVEDQEAIGDFLLLARSLVYSDNREDLMRAVESALMPYTLVASTALDDLIQNRLEARQALENEEGRQA